MTKQEIRKLADQLSADYPRFRELDAEIERLRSKSALSEEELNRLTALGAVYDRRGYSSGRDTTDGQGRAG